MEHTNRSIRRLAVIAASVLFLIIPLAAVYQTEQNYIRYQQSLLGRLYREYPELSKEYLVMMFDTSWSEEDYYAGEQAFIRYGYTEKGMEFLWQRQNIRIQYLRTGIYGVLALLVCIILLTLWRKRERKRIIQLNKSIRNLELRMDQAEYLDQQNKRLQAFIENIAHQIKTPISRVIMSLELLQEEQTDRMQTTRLEECFSHLETIKQLTARLIDIGRMEAGKILFNRDRLQLLELLEDSARAGAGEQKQISLELIPADIDTTYYGDYEWLKEAFTNLFKNCSEHDTSDLPIEVTCKKESDHFMIRIRDHGPGFADADIPNLFSRFYQPQQVKHGHTGIGLNLAKLVFEGHLGSIHALNYEAGGAMFEIRLPIYGLKPEKI